MSYVYKQSEPGLFTVGFYAPDGKWEPESDHHDREEAAKRVHYMNGGKEEDSSSHTAKKMPKSHTAKKMLSPIKDFSELPVMLSISDVQAIMGLSRASTFNLVHSPEFPLLRVNRRLIIPRDKFLAWLETNIQ